MNYSDLFKEPYLLSNDSSNLNNTSLENFNHSNLNQSSNLNQLSNQSSNLNHNNLNFPKNTFKKNYDYGYNVYKYGAGILPYTIHKGKLYFLLGKDRYEKYWSDFGGRPDPVDENKIENTAVREFYEETIGAIYDIKIIKERIKNKKDTYIVKSMKTNNVEYTMYIMRIPYKDYRFTFNNIRNFIKYLIDCNKGLINVYKHFLEKEDLMWISYESLMYHIENSLNDNDNVINNDLLNIPIRQVFKNIITENIDIIKTIE